MYRDNRAGSAARNYRTLDLHCRVSTASPHALVSLLYENLDLALAAASVASALGRGATCATHLGRARSTLVALEAGLDFEQGGDLAASLSAIYRAMLRQLGQAEIGAEGINAVRNGVQSLAQSWRHLVV
jgi:flagellar secretion chaperone FliS